MLVLQPQSKKQKLVQKTPNTCPKVSEQPGHERHPISAESSTTAGDGLEGFRNVGNVPNLSNILKDGFEGC